MNHAAPATQETGLAQLVVAEIEPQAGAEFVPQLFETFLRAFAGAFLTIFGTLYGTIEVAPTVLREIVGAFDPEYARRHARALRKIAVSWSGFGGFLVLAWTFFIHLARGTDTPPGLIALLTPANLFTGVLACGLICLLAAWTDWKFLPPGLRTGIGLNVLNVTAGGIFLALGLKGYWDHGEGIAFLILAGTLAAGWLGAVASKRFLAPRHRDNK